MNNSNNPDYNQYRHPLKRPVQTIGMSSSMGNSNIHAYFAFHRNTNFFDFRYYNGIAICQ